MLKGIKAVGEMLKEASKSCESIVAATKKPECVIKQMAREGKFTKEQKHC